MQLRGPKQAGEKIVAVEERALKQWRKNVAHLVIFGEKRRAVIKNRKRLDQAIKPRTAIHTSPEIRAFISKLARKRGVSVEEMVGLIVNEWALVSLNKGE